MATQPNATRRAKEKRLSNQWSVFTLEDLELERRRRGLSRMGMAQLLKISPSTYSNWTRGRTAPTKKKQNEIATKVLAKQSSRPSDEGLAAISSIVAAYTKANAGRLSPEQLVHTTLQVRRALSGR